MRLFFAVGLLALQLVLTGCLRRNLLNDVSEKDAREIAVVLSRNGISASISKQQSAKKDSSSIPGQTQWMVHIHGADETLIDAWQVLQQSGLPRAKEKGLDEVFTGTGLIPTAGEEKARMLVGMAGEMNRTLRTIPGVVDARVHIAVPENSPLSNANESAPTTASVLVTYWSSGQKPDEDKIKQLVAKGVQGLKPDNVFVYPTPLQESVAEIRKVSQQRVKPTLGFVLDYSYRIAGGIFAFLILVVFGPAIYRRFLERPQVWLKQQLLRRLYDHHKDARVGITGAGR